MDHDPLIRELDELERSSQELESKLRDLREAVREIRDALGGGHRISEVLASGPGVPARRAVRESWDRLNRSLHRYRATVIRELVDGEGMTIAEAARVTRNARQVISRLYHSTDDREPGNDRAP
jgi:hypothetical protein